MENNHNREEIGEMREINDADNEREEREARALVSVLSFYSHNHDSLEYESGIILSS